MIYFSTLFKQKKINDEYLAMAESLQIELQNNTQNFEEQSVEVNKNKL
jgi:hypothetical protein